MKVFQNTTKVWQNETSFLYMVMVIYLLLPIAYGAYLMLDAMMLQSDIATILNGNAVEAINLLVNISGIYSGYVVYQYAKSERMKMNYLALFVLFIAQLCFMNYVGVLLLIIYVSRFLGFKKLKEIYKNTTSGKNFKVLLPALLVCFVAAFTLFLRFRLGLLF